MDIFDSDGKSIYEQQKKSKKKYVLFLFSTERLEPGRQKFFETALASAIKDFTVIRIEDLDEALKALLVKNVELVVMDSSFLHSDMLSVEFALECKKKKKVPILFVPLEPSNLIREYRDKLYGYQEFDDYLNVPLDESDLVKKLKKLGYAKSRAAKRYEVNVPIIMYRLNNDRQYSVFLNDLSLVGFGVKIESHDIFKISEQVQIKIPIYRYGIFDRNYGDFLKISGRLRRVSIDAKTLGFSNEFLSSTQSELLMNLIEKLSMQTKSAPPTIKKIKELDAGVDEASNGIKV